LELDSDYNLKRNLVKNTSDNTICLRNKIITCEVIKEGIIDLDHYLIIADNNPLLESSKLGPKDIIDISKLIDMDCNMISCMVDNAEHIKEIKELFPDDIREKVKLFAKIETERAIVNFDAILDNTDGIIIKLNAFFTRIPKEEVKKYLT
jgi:pyruvate kinase